MKLKGSLSHLNPLGRLLIFIGICAVMVSIGSVLSYYLAQALFKINLLEENLIEHISHERKNQNVINAYKLAQGIPALLFFVCAPLIHAYLFFPNPLSRLKMDRGIKTGTLIVFFITLLASTPLINWLLYLNEHLDLPLWMREREDEAAILTEAFLSTVSIKGLILNLLVIAIIPAVGEELLFRGVIQQSFMDRFRNGHLAIWLTAALFSAMHMQFFGFIPRMLLGALLGYAFWWSGSLWLSIAGHLLNNGSAVIFAFIAQRQGLPFNQDTIGTEPGDKIILIASVLITTGGLIFMYKNRQNTTS